MIGGQLQAKVKEFVKENRRESEYELLITELRYFDKLVLQLPTTVFFPMFEVGTLQVKQEIQKRIKTMLSQVFQKFENSLISVSSQICDRYSQILRYLEKVLKTPTDVVDMERYKNNLLLEMGNLQEKMFENRKSVFFLMHHEYMYTDSSWDLIKQLHDWPAQLNKALDAADERHHVERGDIEH